MKIRSSNPFFGWSALALAIAIAAVSTPAQAAIPAAERQALIDVYNSTNGDGWGDNTGWLGVQGGECDWYGVSCDGEDTVIYLHLNTNGLTGTLPNSIGNLSNLTRLAVYGNALSGPIPPEIGTLPYLMHLNLGGNGLDVVFPGWLADITTLRDMHLHDNRITGELPSSLGNLESLEVLTLSDNLLSGSIPPTLGDLSLLRRLTLDRNQLSGSIPAALGRLTHVEDLWLENNSLEGWIPSGLGDLSSLRRLSLGKNRLAGPVPPELGNLTQLTLLTLHNNRLSGTLPEAIGHLVNLEEFLIQNNQIIGVVPASFLGLVGLEVARLDMRWNGLWTSDPELDSFLASLQRSGGDWRSTQTVAPAGVAAAETSSTSLTISWTPITYRDDPGGYRVSYATESGGPYTFFGRTASKSSSSLEITGLTPGSYFLIVKSETDPHGDQQNTVTSEPSSEVAATISGGQQIGSQQVVSLIANLDGQFGSHWMSDVKITNPYDQSMRVVLQGTPHDTSANVSDPNLIGTVQPGGTLGIENVFGALFGVQAQGKARLLITATDSQGMGIGVPIVTSNIYNAADDGGEFQTYGAPIDSTELAQAGTVVGDNTVKGAGERYNFDVTTGTTGATIRYTYRDSAGGDERTADASYKANATRQHVDAQNLFGLSELAPDSSIIAYIRAGSAFIRGTPTNNITHDSRSQPWQEVVDVSQLGQAMAAQHASTNSSPIWQIISLIANLTGSQGSNWMSDVKITNPFAEPIIVMLQGTPHDTSASPADPEMTLVLQPGETRGIQDVYSALFGGQAQGKARLTVRTTDTAGVYTIPITTSNIYNVAGTGGEFQTYGPPVRTDRLCQTGTTLGDNTVKGQGERYNFDVVAGPSGATILYTYRDSSGGDERTATVSYKPVATRQHVHAQWLFGLSAFAPNSSIVAEIKVGSAFIRGTPTNNVTNDSRSQPWQPVGGAAP